MSTDQFHEGSFLKTAKLNSNGSLPISITASTYLGRESDELNVKETGAFTRVSEGPSIRFYSHNDDEKVLIKQSISERNSQIETHKNSAIKHSKETFISPIKRKENLVMNKPDEFVENINVQSEETRSSVNNSTTSESYLHSPPSIDTKYYINYEGKLSLRPKVKGGSALEKFREIGKTFEIVTSILNEIILNLDTDENRTNKNADNMLKNVASTFSTTTVHSSKYVSIKDIIQKNKESKKQAQVSKMKSNSIMPSVIPQMSSIVRHLGLPITLSQTQPYLDVKAVYERVLTENDIATNKILTKENDLSIMRETKDDYMQPLVEKEISAEGKEEIIDSPFELRWCFGFNSDVPILNLSTKNQFSILFANSQFSVLYDFHEETMKFLQGHKNTVSCLASDSHGSLLVTADCGKDSRVIIWDTRPCVIQVIQNVHPKGCQLVGLSGSGESLVTVSPPPQQLVQLWLWQQDNNCPAADKVVIESHGVIKQLAMNPVCAEEFALTFETAVTFALYDKKNTNECSGELQLDIHQISSKLGTYTDTTFLSGHYAAALSATSMGYVVMWVKEEGINNKKIHEKHVRLHLTCITHIKAVDDMVAVVTEAGNISFYDPSLTVLYFQKLKGVGPLISLCFNLCGQENVLCNHQSHDSCAVSWCKETNQLVDATLHNRPFTCRHFVVSTTDGQLGYYNMSNGSFKSLLYPSKDIYTAIDIVPQRNYLCVGTSSGKVLLFDTREYKLKVLRSIASTEGQCQAISKLCYSASGFLLACGMHSGAVWLLDPLLLTPSSLFPLPLIHTTNSISHLAFSPDSDFLAVADTGFCISVYSLTRSPVLLGLYQAHSKPIQNIFFTFYNKDKTLKLFTLGADRNITEFNIVCESSGSYSFLYQCVHRVEQSAVPLCITPYPSCDSHYLVANSEMKFKLLDSRTLKCCKTFQAPDLGSNIIYLEKLNEHCLVFATSHHIGLQLLPIDGNPYKALGYHASATPIISCKVHPNGKYLFVISENCPAINKWRIKQQAVEEWCKSGGEGLTPFLSLLEGGRGGWREQNIKDFFLVGQFSHQGERPSVVRALGNSVTTSQVINILQALGFFPTQYQISNIMLEVQGSTCPLHPALTQHRITFEDLVRLYVNHRPSQDLSLEELRRAFHLLGGTDNLTTSDNESVFSSVAFANKLTVTGEEIHIDKLHYDLNILMVGKADTIQQPQKRQSLLFMPKNLSFKTFIKEVLGFQDYSSGTFDNDS